MACVGQLYYYTAVGAVLLHKCNLTTVYKLYYYTYNTEGELKMTTELKAAAEELGTVQDDGDEAPTCENCGAKKTVVGGTIRADGIGERTDYACLNCTCGKCGKKKTMKLNIDYGNGSREIVYSCTNCNRPPVSADPWGTSRAVLMSLVQYYDITGEYKIRNKRQVEIFIKYLKDKGYSIVRTDSLSDNRNGCYNTRTDHRIQRRLR